MLIIWTKFTQKEFFLVENRKSEHQHWIVHIQISVGNKFQLQLTSLIFWQIYPKRVFPVKNEKSEHQMHIRISLYSEFHLRLTTLIFWTKFVQKGYF